MAVDARALNEVGKKCTRGEAPRCTAACPLHVDIKALTAAVAAGEFTAARLLLEAKSPLAGLLAYLCDAPCMERCRRGDLDTEVQIPLLERACIEHGAPPEIACAPQKKQRIAVVGSGLSGLSAALTLLRSGYGVTVYEAKEQLGGTLRGQNSRLPAQLLEQELARLAAGGAELRLNLRIGTEHPLEELAESFDAVCLACGRAGSPLLPAERIDPFTLRIGQTKLFAAGSLGEAALSDSPVRLAESGRRAAVSITRLLQRVSLSANRTQEHVCESALYTSLAGRETVPATIPANGRSYTAAEAETEGKRCLSCRCDACMEGCVYLRRFDKYAGDCIKAVVKNITMVSGWGGEHTLNTLINSCNLCGLCKERCPTDVDLGYVNLQARRYLWEQGTLPAAIHDFPLRDLEFSCGEAALAEHQSGYSTSRYLFFTGCQLPASMPETVKKAYLFFTQKLQGGVGLLMNCCGAPADWAGRRELAAQTRAALADIWAEMGKPIVLVACPGCYKVLHTELPQLPLLMISEVLEGLLPAQKQGEKRFAYHDPCSLRDFPKIQDSDRALAQKAGAAFDELPANRAQTQCCGYGGLQYHISPALSAQTAGERATQSPLPYLTSCSNCRDFFHSVGKESVHLLELVFGCEPTRADEAYGAMDFSRRRARRRKLLGELIPESAAVQAATLPLVISPAMREKMYDQCILEDDIQAVLLAATKSGRSMYSDTTGRMIAGHRKKLITYWVEYTMENGAFVLQNCYSHRMQVQNKYL